MSFVCEALKLNAARLGFRYWDFYRREAQQLMPNKVTKQWHCIVVENWTDKTRKSAIKASTPTHLRVE